MGRRRVRTHQSRIGLALRRDARGAVLVEKLIVFVPVLLTFFAGWELAEVAAANIVVQRASAAAGRAAMVVLPDDPLYYGDEPTHSYGGARRADIELAAGMVLSAVPHIAEDFQVEVSDPPSGFGSIDVTVTATYDCSTVGLVCGLNGRLALSATTAHAYHGARYAYSAAGGGGVAGTQQALTARGGSGVEAKLQAVTTKGDGAPSTGKPGTTSQGSGANSPATGTDNADDCGSGRKYDQCDPSFGLDKPGRPTPADNIAGPPPPIGTGYDPSSFAGEDNISYEAIRHRCNNSKVKNDQNVSVIRYRCENPARTGYFARGSGKAGGKKGNHSEQNVYQEFKKEHPGCTIVEFYTERESCTDKCHGWFDTNDETKALRAKTTYTFRYNNKYDTFDPGKANDAWIVALRDACTPFNGPSRKRKRDGGEPGFGKSECERMQDWANSTDMIDGKHGRTEANMRKCLEYKQIRDDAARLGNRERAQTETNEQIAQAKAKLCSQLRGTQHPSW